MLNPLFIRLLRDRGNSAWDSLSPLPSTKPSPSTILKSFVSLVGRMGKHARHTSVVCEINSRSLIEESQGTCRAPLQSRLGDGRCDDGFYNFEHCSPPQVWIYIRSFVVCSSVRVAFCLPCVAALRQVRRGRLLQERVYGRCLRVWNRRLRLYQ